MHENHAAPIFDPARALVAVQREGSCIAVAWGSNVVVVDTRTSELVQLPGADQQLPLRALAFDGPGKLLLAAGDSKICCVWDCASWNVVLRTIAPKKISAAGFTTDGQHVMMADKFGDVYIAALLHQGNAPASLEGEGLVSKPHMLLGHFSSIVTTLTALEAKPWLVSTDREGKVRVSKLLKDPKQGAPSVQSFCMGHTAFVTSLAVLDSPEGPLIASGSGDGTIRVTTKDITAQDALLTLKSRLWDPVDGSQLDRFDTTSHLLQESTQEALQVQGEGGSGRLKDPEKMPEVVDPAGDEGVPSSSQVKVHENLPPAVVALVSLPSRSCALVAAVEGEGSLMVLTCSRRKLELSQRACLPLVDFPTCLALDSQGTLYGVSGCVGVQPFSIGAVSNPESAVQVVPNMEQSYRALKSALPESAASAAATSSSNRPGTQVSLELRKWCYSEEEILRRKRNRRDIASVGDVTPQNAS